MFDKETLTSLVIGFVSSILIVILEKILKIIFKSKSFLNFVQKSKIVLLHFLLSYIIWFLSKGLSDEVRLLSIFVINLIILISRFKESPIDGTVSLRYKKAPFIRIKLYKLKQTDKDDKTELSWESFGKCVDNLIKNINKAPSVSPDIIFGVNETGIMAASCLSDHMKSKPRLGIIKTSNKLPPDNKRQILQFDFPSPSVIQFNGTTDTFPNIKKPRTIAIVDLELKTGKSIKCIMEMIKQRYGQDIEIYYIVLVGVVKEEDKDKKINDIMMFGWDIEEMKNKPDFISFYIDSPGVRGPGGMR